MSDKQQTSIPPGEEIDKASESSKDDNSAKQRLLEAATQLFSEHGLEGTSTRDIAKAADLNISLISYYFGGKEGLYKAVILEFANRAQMRIHELMGPVDLKALDRETFKKTMHGFISGMLPMKFASCDIQKILQREVIAGLPFAREVYEKVFSEILETVASFYKAGQTNGFVRKELNPYIIFLAMTHSTDSYFQMCQCRTSVQGKVLQLPDKMDQYIQQVYMLYVEGVLV